MSQELLSDLPVIYCTVEKLLFIIQKYNRQI